MNDREYYRLFNPTPEREEYDGQKEFESDPVGMIHAIRVDPKHGKGEWSDLAIDVLLAEIDGHKVEIDRLTATNAALMKEIESLNEQLSDADAAIQREGKNAYKAGNQDGYKEGFKDAEREYRRD